VIGCQHEGDGKNLLAELRDRLTQFGLSVHEGKTRLIAFGRFTAASRSAAGQRRPQTFSFLGFTHYCGKTRSGKFVVKRKTQVKRLVRKLQEIRAEMRRRMHAPVREQHRWLCQVLRGHYRYYGVIFNSRALRAFQTCVVKLLAQDTRQAEPKRPRYLGVLQPAPDRLPAPRTGYPSGLAQMIAPPPVLPEEPAAVTPHGGFRGGKSQQWLRYPINLHVRFNERGVETEPGSNQ
jgi:hypothetical protein